MVADVLVDDQRVAVVRHDRRRDRPAQIDAAAIELIRAQRDFRAGVRLHRSEWALGRRHAVLAAARQLGHSQVLEQTVLQRWRSGTNGRVAGRMGRAVIGQPTGEVQ